MLGTVKGTRLMMLLWFVILLFLITYYATRSNPLAPKEQSSNGPSKSLNQLIQTGERVGYYNGSFVFDLLKDFGLSEKQLFPYLTDDELLGMISKGNTEGGISVAIDDTLELSGFIAQHCNKYTLVPVPSLHASGYGFAFRQDLTKLVQEVSNGIIKLIDNGQLGKIQARTLGDSGTCEVEPDSGVDDIASDIASPDYSQMFKVCAILSVALFVIIYVVFIISTNRRCLRYLFP